MVIAQEQTAGRGRSGNDWWQATRAIAASLACRLGPIRDSFTLGVGLSVRSAILDITDVETRLKWPNDIETADGKVGGILVELRDDVVIVGCGLNLFWPDAPSGAAGLLSADPGTELGVEISRAWAESVLDTGGAWDRNDYIAACSTIGAEITWSEEGRGKALTVDDRGGLVVTTDTGPITLRSGEIQAVRRVSDDA